MMATGRLAKVTTGAVNDLFVYQVPAGKFFIGSVVIYNNDSVAREHTLYGVDAADTGGRNDRPIAYLANVPDKGTFTVSGLILAQQQKLYVDVIYNNSQSTITVIGFERDDT